MGATMMVDQAPARRRITGAWLVLARLAWVLVFVASMAVVFATIPESYTRVTTICTPPACADDQITADGAANLAAMGISLGFVAWYNITCSVIFAVVYAALATLIFWRRPDDPMAIYVSMTLIFFGSSISERIVADNSGGYFWQLLVALWPVFAWISFANLLYLFPDGSFTPRWTRWLALIWVLMVALPLSLNRFVSGLLYNIINIATWPPLPQFALILLLFGGGLYGQYYRFRYRSNPVQRQQTKWVVYGLSVVTAAVILLNELPSAVIPAQVEDGTLARLVIDAFNLVILIFMAVAFVVAILRYRLWDIDLVIRRTLVYSLLSGVLALVYFGCVLLFEGIRPALWAERSAVETMVSTLLIAALVAPLRRVIQAFIDRRFYRRKYDAEQVVSALTGRLQREVDMPNLRAALISAVLETWQPARASLWLAAEPERPAPLNGQPSAISATDETAPPVIAPSDPLLSFVEQEHPLVQLDSLKLDSPAVHALRSQGIQLLAPLISQGDLVGLLSLGPRRSEQEYSADDLKLLRTLASQAAPALRVAQMAAQQRLEALQRERVEQEMRVARIIQETLLPRQVPPLDGWRLDAFWQPAQAVGGDFYDFIGLSDGCLGIVIGDVTDKGVPAALMMASTRSILRSAAERHHSPGAVLASVNNLLVPEMPPRMFVTCLYAIFDPASGRVWIANAGHNLPSIRTAQGNLELRATGMPLGLLPEMTYEEAEIMLAPGESLLLYSDGLVEAHDPQRAMFGFPRVRASVGVYGQGGLIAGLRNELADFTGPDWVQEDDVTLVVLDRLPVTIEHSPATSVEQPLLRLSVPSIAGNERAAVSEIIAAVKVAASLPASQLERIQTAVAETLMNAIEHGNHFERELMAEVEVLLSPERLVVRVTDHGGERPIPAIAEPDLEAKLAGLQSPRGWGLFLVQSMVDELNVQSNEDHHEVELVFNRTSASLD